MSGTNAPPMLTVAANGNGVVLDAQLNTFVQGGALLAQMRNFVGISNMLVWMIGTSTPGDGGQGMFYWNPTATAADDNGATTIQPSGVVEGRWLRAGEQAGTADVAYQLNAVGTGSFWTTQNPAAVSNNAGDRLFGGAATAYSGAAPVAGDTYTWLDTVWGYFIVPNSTWAVVDSHSMQAFTAASESSNTIPPASQIGVAGGFYGYNPAATQAVGAWGIYTEGRRTAGSYNSVYGIETNATNLGAVVGASPWDLLPGGVSYAVLAASGGGDTKTLSATAALGIAPGPSNFSAGIVIGATALAGTDGSTGLGTAMALANYQVISWAPSSGTECGQIFCETTNVGNFQELRFSNGGLTVAGSDGNPQMQVPPVANATNGISMVGAATGAPVVFAAIGTDTNVSMVMTPKGTGTLMTASEFAPQQDNAYSLGNADQRWTAVWAVNGTIQTSDATLKTDIRPLPAALPLLASINPVTFKWKDGGRRLTATKEWRAVPVTEETTVTVKGHEVQPDGRVFQVDLTRTRKRQKVRMVPVVQPDGTPVTDRVRTGGRGNRATFTTRPRMHPVGLTINKQVAATALVAQAGKRTHWGFLAADVKKAFDGIGMDFGGYVRAPDGLECLRPDQLIPVLWKAVQELSAQVAELRAARPAPPGEGKAS